jgi:hypothetical protein
MPRRASLVPWTVLATNARFDRGKSLGAPAPLAGLRRVEGIGSPRANKEKRAKEAGGDGSNYPLLLNAFSEPCARMRGTPARETTANTTVLLPSLTNQKRASKKEVEGRSYADAERHHVDETA